MNLVLTVPDDVFEWFVSVSNSETGGTVEDWVDHYGVPRASRFCDGKSGFAVMYASMSFETCVVETLVRDRFTHRLKRELPLAAVRARHFAAGQALGRAVYEEHPDVDGFIYASRLTGDDCIAVFDRAIGKLTVVDACELKEHAELPAVLERNKVMLVE